MPRRTDRQIRAGNLVKGFIDFVKNHARRVKRRGRRDKRLERELRPYSQISVDLFDDPQQTRQLDDVDMEPSSHTDSSISDNVSVSDSSSSSSEGSWGSLLQHTSIDESVTSLDESSSLTSLSESGREMDMDFEDTPDLLPAGYPDSDDEEESGEESDEMEEMDNDEWDWGVEADVDSDWVLDDYAEVPRAQGTTRMSNFVREAVEEMYAHRYEAPRNRMPRPPADLRHLLDVDKHERPDVFRRELRVSPYTFDRMVNRILDDPIFSNNSQNEQMPVEDQLAITLYRFGHFGNAAGLDKVARWSGYSKGTVSLATRRVMTAVLRRDFMNQAVRPPTPEEKERAKHWVERNSCKAWRDGWCMVDGTLVTLYDRPFWYGESYYDRKCNYSLNIQIISMPNRRIIDFGYGFTGSTHDSTAWEETRFYQDYETFLQGEEFIWGDSAYPIEIWLVAPYKRPDRDVEDNEIFNNHLSIIRIRSEHAIGFLKGRFQSLKGLRINIKNEATHKFATYWVVSCIGLHGFAMICEAEERGGSSTEETDPFIMEGLSSTRSSSDNGLLPLPRARRAAARSLPAAKARRERLKAQLFRAKERQALRRQHRRNEGESSEGSSDDE
ncbi:putative DDE superfamily endonuclease [Lyophyllum shimeji]|uniref:DDE superfamily endonuclease n=1 Tax=Lyophyllum shimeji TaxID=47721 RepID=A0A9P3PEN1_LYOSH|nr:putative DDE superfamily endonuclease [Lyophyllum shimeji]